MNCDCIPSRKCRAGIEVRGGGGGGGGGKEPV